MSGKNQIDGGAFQDFEGNPLTDGYLTMQLSHDEQESVDPGMVVAGYPLRVPLDTNGNIQGVVSVWPNDQLAPANSYYIVNAYRANGTQAWLSPQNFTVTSSPSPFNVGAWVPVAGVSVVPALTLQVNGTNNGSQSLLNLAAGSNITITDGGIGTVTIASTGGVAAGANITLLPALGAAPLAMSLIATGTLNSSGAAKSFVQLIPQNAMLCYPLKWTASITTVSTSTTVTMQVAQCTIGTGTVISATNITFSGSGSPTLAPAGLYTSDAISFALTTGFDYYIILNSSTGLIGYTVSNATGAAGASGGVYVEPSNFLSTTPLTFSGGTPEAGKSILFTFQSA